MIGKTILHYRILEELGRGGMGIVYKAQDTKLDRIVALKFLPEHIEASEEDKARFLQEARAASAVIHPNVCVIHDIAEHKGKQFIVMEYIDGRTLRQLLPVEKVQDAIGYAKQIGEALEEAHGKGVIHRDVKTDNIMVNARNQIKVMDFGLAKLKGSLRLTKTSSTVGTLAYMAPEQIQGGIVDGRSDIFSFGVVLYEMLTGRLPFRGEYEAALMFSILNEEPEPIQKHLPEVSSELAHILNRALEKSAEDRYQSVHDMVIDLRRAKKETSRVTRVPSGSGVDEKETLQISGNKKSRRKSLVGGLIGSLLFVVVILLMVVFRSRIPKLNPNMTFRVLPIPFTEVGRPGLSRDGNWAAFAALDENAKYDIYYMNTTSGESRRITSDSCLWIYCCEISPDGSQILFDRLKDATSQWDIAIISYVGGSGKVIANGGIYPRWRPDGQRIGYVRAKYQGSQSGKVEFWTVRSDGSDNRFELVDSLSARGRSFSWSPDGKFICWIRYLSVKCQEIMIYRLSTGEAKQLTFDKKEISDVYWAFNDQILFASNKNGNFNIWMVPASGGTATQITKGAGPDYSMEMSSDGSKLLYYQDQILSHIWIAGTDGSNPRQITFDDAYLWRVAFSPNGKQILFGQHQTTGMKEGDLVCVIDKDGRNRKQLNLGNETINNPLMSPDGKWIVYGRHPLSDPSDSSRLALIDANNPGRPKLIGKWAPMRWIDNNRFVAWDFNYRSWIYSIEGSTPIPFFKDSTYAIPLKEGRYIGYYDHHAGKDGVWICAAPGVFDSNLRTPRCLGLMDGEFDKEGNYFYYAKNVGELRRILIPNGKEEMIHGVFPGLTPVRSWFDISYNGKEIVYTDARFNNRFVMIENIFK